MKSVFLTMVFALLTSGAFLSSANAQTWSGTNCMDITGCTAGIAVDSGNNSKRCGGTWNDCSCHGIANGCPAMVRNYCNFGETDLGATVLGKRCCMNSNLCRTDLEEPVVLEMEVEGEESLGQVFDGFNPAFTTAYYGVVNSTNRSPSAGRGNSVHAKLDACLGHANVDADSDFFTCSTSCNNSLKNQYCLANNSEVCVDRCECRWGESGCNGL